MFRKTLYEKMNRACTQTNKFRPQLPHVYTKLNWRDMHTREIRPRICSLFFLSLKWFLSNPGVCTDYGNPASPK